MIIIPLLGYSDATFSPSLSEGFSIPDT